MKKKKALSFILAAVLTSTVISGCKITEQDVQKIVDVVNEYYSGFAVQKEVPLYCMSKDNESTIDLYFMTEDASVPYINIESIKDLMETFYKESDGENTKYSLTIETDDDEGIATLFRETGYTMTIDFKKNIISFYDYNMFIAHPHQDSVVSVLEVNSEYDGDEAMDAFYSKAFKISDISYSRYGSVLDINAGDYGINFIQEGQTYYVPLQIINDFLIAPNYVLARYNGEAVFLDAALSPDEELSELYYKAPAGERSQELIDFTYNELCLALDHLYGLKESHSIKKFDDFFQDTGLFYGLTSSDNVKEFTAIYQLLYYYFDDLHSAYTGNSSYMGINFAIPKEVVANTGISNSTYLKVMNKFQEAESYVYPEGRPAYEEIGNTAYISFNSFEDPMDVNYYEKAPDENATDTVGIMAYAYSQITREDSPVENVVLDLSQNSGGSSYAACYTIGTMLGMGNVTIADACTGANSAQFYEVDANLDGKFDEKDYKLTNYKLYCLTSPLSFSCGNLVPSVLKSSHEVVTIGQTSGGGACVVLPMSLADGTTFCISGPNRISHSVNGSMYDIDQGVTADVPIYDINNYYDRDILTLYINSLF